VAVVTGTCLGLAWGRRIPVPHLKVMAYALLLIISLTAIGGPWLTGR